MTRFVVGSFLLALVELIGFAAYTATHRVGASVVAVRPDRGGSYGSSRLTRAPASRSRSPVPRRHSTSALRDNGARANLNASVRGIKHADPPFFEGSLAWESSPSLPGGCALIAASTELDDRPGPSRDYLVRAWRDLLDFLVGTVRSAIEEGQFRPDLDLARFAYEFWGAMLGYHHASRLGRDPDASARVLRAFESLVRVARATGGVIFVVDPAEKHYNPIGMVHGGAAAALLAPDMGWAVRLLLPAAAGCTTLDLDIRYVKPITVATGTIVASGTVLHHGRCTATAEGRLGAADTGALLAHSPSTLLVLS
jgi:uncharacterized protein (TIGR00369 family)